jgi:pyruvate dehydrogenase E2 component (dihydrolipoamide acetyltransferase)
VLSWHTKDAAKIGTQTKGYIVAHEVIMPQMGESIAEGTITSWLKAIGEKVERDEPLFEMSTDKVDAEIPSPVAGTLLEIKVQPGETVAINTVVAIVGVQGESTKAATGGAPSAAAQADTPKVETPSSSPEPDAALESVEQRRRTKSSPVVRKIAAQHDIDISVLHGTGISGRVTKKDILAHIEDGAASARAAVPLPSVATGPSTIPAAYRPKVFPGDRVEDMSKMRSLIADHMVLSRQISSHVQTVWEADFSHVGNLRKKYKSKWQENNEVNLTFTAFIMKTAVDALKAFPVLNASLDGQRIIYHRNVNLGMAVALEQGLIVPVIKNADELNLLGLTRRLNDLGSRARDKKLKPDEVQDGTFTITNPGVFGNLFGLPVINQPQVAILGVGGIEKRPVVIDDMIAIRTRCYLSLSFDHRLVDGAIADQFMRKIKEGIENFDESEL